MDKNWTLRKSSSFQRCMFMFQRLSKGFLSAVFVLSYKNCQAWWLRAVCHLIWCGSLGKGEAFEQTWGKILLFICRDWYSNSWCWICKKDLPSQEFTSRFLRGKTYWHFSPFVSTPKNLESNLSTFMCCVVDGIGWYSDRVYRVFKSNGSESWRPKIRCSSLIIKNWICSGPFDAQ